MDPTLRLKIQEAAKQYKAHNFKRSLIQYEQCISDVSRIKNNSSRNLLLNLYAAKTTLQLILQKYEDAEDTLEIALSDDPFHIELLTRRSQLYKKRNKIREAIQDLDMVAMFSPGNIQIVALRLELENLVINKSTGSENNIKTQKQSEQQIDLDQQASLHFTNLKIIDRKSVTLKDSPFKASRKRESRVTISGDSAFFYDTEQEQLSQQNLPYTLPIELAMKRSQSIEKELAADTAVEEKMETPKVKYQSKRSVKSILKNRSSAFQVQKDLLPQLKSVKLESRKSSFIERLKDIEGKVIKPEMPEREVGFRKSISFPATKVGQSKSPNSSGAKKNASVSSRKSCLKRSSFECPEIFPKASGNKPVRGSKFDMLSSMSIDGGMIRKNPKEPDEINQNDENKSVNSDDDESSSHNIFGSQQFVLSKEIRQNFGLDEQMLSKKVQDKKDKERGGGGKSILKKMSIFASPKDVKLSRQNSPEKKVIAQQKEVDIVLTQTNPDKQSQFKLKSKKSVMFKG